uniref:Uncharacterized protein n=1 Tax=Cucumis melo TaxID=3656 RepID=A0A9I9E7W5_CUCME
MRGIAYSLLLVLRQSWSKQFAPIICGLEVWKFSYESDVANKKKFMKQLRHGNS